MINIKLLLKASLLTSILLIIGCGQKGPLFLEEKKDEKVNSSQDDRANTRPEINN